MGWGLYNVVQELLGWREEAVLEPGSNMEVTGNTFFPMVIVGDFLPDKY